MSVKLKDTIDGIITRSISDESGNNIKSSYGSSLSVSGKQVSIISKSGQVLSTITTQDTTYSLSSFGISASSTELNYTKGVTSAIQTQLNNKANTSGTYSGITSGDSSKLGGLSSSQYQKNLNGSITDFNSTAAITQGEYSVIPPATNGPGTQYGKLITIVNDGTTHNNSTNWIWQIYYDTSNTIWFRNKTNSSAWTGWRTITVSNGSYSGMSVGYSTNSGNLGGVAASSYINTSDTLVLVGTI